jgi:hypothetical protein
MDCVLGPEAVIRVAARERLAEREAAAADD